MLVGMSRISKARKDAKSTQTKMYTHFAAVTLVVTLLIALFAEGENPAASAEETAKAEQNQPDQVDLAVQGKDTNKIRIASNTKVVGSFGPDTGGSHSYSGSSSSSSGLGDFTYSARQAAGSIGSISGVALPANMTPEKWNELIEKRRKGEELDQDRAQDIEEMLALSRQRAGAATAPGEGDMGY